MAVFQRAQVDTLLRRLAEPPRFIIAVFGPRQTGKTTIVRQALRRLDRPSRYLAVDEPDTPGFRIPPTTAGTTLRRPQARDAEWLVAAWEEARRVAVESPTGSVLVLDEIQKIPNWSETVKGLWDADRAMDWALHVIVLGSSPLR
ncbi:MAG: AAA family ATPase, partial [Acidobacteriota bacterium]|nr:AAA family ATPase [Acidobacteriota bacterium]